MRPPDGRAKNTMRGATPTPERPEPDAVELAWKRVRMGRLAFETHARADYDQDVRTIDAQVATLTAERDLWKGEADSLWDTVRSLEVRVGAAEVVAEQAIAERDEARAANEHLADEVQRFAVKAGKREAERDRLEDQAQRFAVKAGKAEAQVRSMVKLVHVLVADVEDDGWPVGFFDDWVPTIRPVLVQLRALAAEPREPDGD